MTLGVGALLYRLSAPGHLLTAVGSPPRPYHHPGAPSQLPEARLD